MDTVPESSSAATVAQPLAVTMHRVRRPGLPLYLMAIGGVALTTLICLPMLGWLDLANIVLLFVMSVVIIASLCGRGPGVLSAFLGVACFDFFFVPPRFSFTVDQAQYLVTFVVMLVVSLVISHLTNAYREKAHEAEQRALEATLLHVLAGKLSAALTTGEVATQADALLHEHFQAQSRLWLPAEKSASSPLTCVQGKTELAEQVAAQGVYQSGKAVRAARYLHGDLRTDLHPLHGLTRLRGVLAIDLPESRLRPADSFLTAVAALVCTAIERIHFVNVAHSSELDVQSERLRSSLLSAISHDVRTPLTVIFGVADALAAEPGLQAGARDKALALREHALGLHRMVENLLDMARLRSGRVVLRTDWQSVPEIFGASVASLPSLLKEHRLRIDWAQDLPLVWLDARLLERVFCSLLENAAKYSPRDSLITVSARAEQSWLILDLDNEGTGFPPDRLEQVFGLFERGNNETAGHGAGLGLAICRSIVEAHGGRIRACNISGGARVSLSLPLGDVPVTPSEGSGNE